MMADIPFSLQEAEKAISEAGVPASAVANVQRELEYVHLRRPDGQFVKGHNGKVYPTCDTVAELAAEIEATYERLEKSGLLMR
jgi:hypothetical protein